MKQGNVLDFFLKKKKTLANEPENKRWAVRVEALFAEVAGEQRIKCFTIQDFCLANDNLDVVEFSVMAGFNNVGFPAR